LNGIKELFDKYGFTSSKTGKKILKLKVGRRKSVGNYGETHTLTVDTWKPDSANGGGGGVYGNSHDQQPGDDAFDDLDDSIPF
jgi:hypothetical protein